jgi:GPH family glycoside/pentoside/hexuronide:cation symporter
MTFGATVAIPNSMLADVIDYDELVTNDRREGVFLGIWAVIRKVAAALGVGVALPMMQAAGYEPNVEQTDTTKLVIRLLYVGVPVVCNVLAIVVAWRYPIDKERHAEIRQRIAEEHEE